VIESSSVMFVLYTSSKGTFIVPKLKNGFVIGGSKLLLKDDFYC